MEPLISIIIPSYNTLPFLAESINSALTQNYQNLEVIVIDDGSTDGSFDYLRKLNYPNLIIRKNKRKGACAARNYGFEQSKGDYIQFLDADDILSPNKIASQVANLANTDYTTIASCKWQHFVKIPGDLNQNTRQLIDRSYDHPINWLIDSWNGGGMGQSAVWLTPRKLIEEAGKWNESLLKNQDGEFFFRVLLKASRVIFNSDSIVHYRKPQTLNISQNKSKEAIESLLMSYNKYEEVLRYRDDKIVRKALARNYNNFIYLYHNTYPVLSQEAEKCLGNLQQKVLISFANPKLRALAKIIGWKSIIKTRKCLKGY